MDASLLPHLPIPRTRLVGREQERAAARAMLFSDPVPLLTLTRPGGVGKARLAIAFAGEFEGSFEHGVIWVDLAPITDPSLVRVVIAAAASLTSATHQPPIDLFGQLFPPAAVTAIAR